MPRRVVRAKRSYAKKFKGGKKKRTAAPKRRRLQGMGYHYAKAAASSAGMYNLRGSYGNRAKGQFLRGKHGASKPDAASGANGGRNVGRARPLRKIIAKRRSGINRALADLAYPIIKDHALENATQLDWTSNQQGVKEYIVGYTTAEIQTMITQAASAQSVATSAMIVPSVGSEKNIKMDIYDKITKYNMKNTCSHTIYVEVHAYVSKIYHGFPVKTAWETAMLADNMVQNAASFGTEQTSDNIGNRPDFRLADLNVRWRERKDAKFKITLEPGQETHYTYVQKGQRFDQAKYNVLQGNSSTGDDINYLPGLSSSILIFCRGEMVADALDSDVTYGSGHLAINVERWKSWAAVPYVKPIQTSFTNSWGDIIESNELDMNQYQANNDVYEEQV